MTVGQHLPLAALEAGIDEVRRAPSGSGTLELIVRRPDVDERDVVDEGRLDVDLGLVGDGWKPRGNDKTPDGSADPERQVTIMSARAAALVAGERDRWPLAGDQLYVDFDLSEDNLPAGTQLEIGEAVLEVSAAPHLGCNKFSARFGPDALRFVNSEIGRQLHLRGINTKVVQGGTIRVGDAVRKLS